jgi:Flp pilus assembly protein TadG
MLALGNLFFKFGRDTRGAIAIIFGFVFLILVAVVGGAVDYGQWTRARSATQNAMDAAVLAGGRVMQLPNTTDAQVLAVAQKYFDENKPSYLEPENVTFSIGADGTEVIGTSMSSAVKTPFLGVIGIPNLPVNETASAKLSVGANSGSDVEVSMMLDVTGSMDGSKINDLKAAANDLVDIVVWDDQSTYTSRVALAPFSRYVNVGLTYFTAVTGQSAGSNSKTCVKERDTSHRFTDDRPNSGDYFDAYTGSNTCKPTATILPLTNDKGALRNQIDSLGASGTTAGHLGTAWAWYLLSPKWNSIWPISSEPKAYNQTTEVNANGQPKLHKIALLMTDGTYNKWYTGDDSTTQARILCTNMKAAGVTVYTVGFAIAVGSEPDVTMQQCAVSPAYYYNAADGNALKLAFRDIALKIMTLRLSK